MGIHSVEKTLIAETQKINELADLQRLTTAFLARRVKLSRNTVSQYLNELLKQEKVIQIKSRPTNFADRATFCEHFFTPKQNVYASLPELIHEQHNNTNAFETFIGSQQSMKEGIDRIITAVSYPPNGLPFVLSGNTGVGKSYLAKLTYQYCIESGILDAKAPFIVLNCAQYYHNPELLSSNLFGYAKGSFTGATTDFKGMLESADGGILFLDECHRLDPESQEKLFSFMDTGTFQRMGEGNVLRHSNVRLIFATTENLEETFLQTFMRRIPIAITVPDLNNRSKSELKQHIYKAFIVESQRLNKTLEVSPWVINRLYNFNYKNNVGELKTTVRILCARVFSKARQKATIHITSETIGNGFLPELLAVNEQEAITQDTVTFTPTSTLADYELQLHDDNRLINELVARLIQLETSYQNKTITILTLKQHIAREVGALMDQLVHQDGRFENEALKYMISVIQQLFDYLDTSFFVNIKGNAIVAIANFMYRKQDFNLSLTTSNQNKISHLLELLKENTVLEYQLLKSFLDLIKTKLDFKMDDLDKLLLLSYLLSLGVDYQRSGKQAIILAHGFSTASSIADVANQFLNGKIFDAFDMPLSVSTSQVKEFMLRYLKKYDCSKGLIILVDMGSLMVLPDILKDLIPGPILIVNNVSTQAALYVGEMIQQDMAIDEIGRKVQPKLLPKYQLTYPILEKRPMIITTCHTGIGAAKQIQTLLTKSIPKKLGYQFESVDFAYLKKYGTDSPIFNQYDVKAIVGTNDPKLAGFPFISLENLVSNDGTKIIQQIFPTVQDPDMITYINDHLIQNFSIERLLSAVTILDVKKVINSVGEMIEHLEESAQIKLANSQRATLYVHISALIERLIRNDPPLTYTPDDTIDRTQGLNQIKRALADIESAYGVKVDTGELNYLYDIIFQS
ncbi:protein SipR [Agrilactobacillus composti DSM 18527 = JCM 14202]|uniref:Protein SipR n=1 Tax=Agrilactobacillus composti DSM 18527 = JCM 14202 TaxID=1423734 RepID=X0PMH1_9LACO|nr:sigma 54-interacting transcriptional regulator [Agrilactobacillus composti]KRM34840.1 protein SipR [Agrilactobacillus composti DSM 18527 = JCM 14202]GAF38697.1 NtrC family transcriptional regulator, ATPase domain [Agrilactobacillus composti DSM 18527 = JCM 14202]